MTLLMYMFCPLPVLPVAQVTSVFLLPEMVERTASMLNYFLSYLTGQVGAGWVGPWHKTKHWCLVRLCSKLPQRCQCFPGGPQQSRDYLAHVSRLLFTPGNVLRLCHHPSAWTFATNHVLRLLFLTHSLVALQERRRKLAIKEPEKYNFKPRWVGKRWTRLACSLQPCRKHTALPVCSSTA
jgi:hypothetical protein